MESARKWIKIKNIGLVASVVSLIRTKKLNVHWVKVKGYLGEIFNEVADRKAKEGANSQKHFVLSADSVKEVKIRCK